MKVTGQAKEMKAAGVDVVSFGAGEPDFDTPAFIKDAAVDALRDGQTKYTPNPSILQLKKAICEKFRRDNGLNYAEDEVTVGPGGKGALYFAFLAVLDEGDEVVLAAPYWVSYPEQAKLAGGVPVVVRGATDNDFKITPQQLDEAITPKTKVVVLNSPSNPAGNCYDPAELKALADVLAKHERVVVFSDEIYEKLLYDGQQTASIATLHPALRERTITFNCHSKSFAMTGWRLGYAGGPAHVIAAMNKLQGQINSHVTSFCQPAAALALTDPRAAEAVEAMRVEFEQRGRHMHARLSSMPGIVCPKPRGAFYCFPDVSQHFPAAGVDDAVGFASKLLEEQHVAVVPGNDSGFDTHVRLSFATSMPQIDKGLDRIEAFLRHL